MCVSQPKATLIKDPNQRQGWQDHFPLHISLILCDLRDLGGYEAVTPIPPCTITQIEWDPWLVELREGPRGMQ